MTVDEMYSLLKFIIRKNQNGNLTPQDFNLIANRASFSYMDYLLGEFQKYLPGRPMAPATFGQNEDIRQRLTPFITTPVPLTINGSTGVAPYPDDFQSDDAMYYGQYNRRVKYIQQDRLDSHVNSVINPISSQDPEWYEIDAMQVVTRALTMLGVNLQLGAVQQYAQAVKTQGQ